MPAGLFNKYKIEKTDGSPTDPDAQCFVLRIDTDDAAQHALYEYADASNDKVLRMDLLHWLTDINPDYRPRRKLARLWLWWREYTSFGRW